MIEAYQSFFCKSGLVMVELVDSGLRWLILKLLWGCFEAVKFVSCFFPFLLVEQHFLFVVNHELKVVLHLLKDINLCSCSLACNLLIFDLNCPFRASQVGGLCFILGFLNLDILWIDFALSCWRRLFGWRSIFGFCISLILLLAQFWCYIKIVRFKLLVAFLFKKPGKLLCRANEVADGVIELLMSLMLAGIEASELDTLPFVVKLLHLANDCMDSCNIFSYVLFDKLFLHNVIDQSFLGIILVSLGKIIIPPILVGAFVLMWHKFWF